MICCVTQRKSFSRPQNDLSLYCRPKSGSLQIVTGLIFAKVVPKVGLFTFLQPRDVFSRVGTPVLNGMFGVAKEWEAGRGYQPSNFEAGLERDSSKCVPTDY